MIHTHKVIDQFMVFITLFIKPPEKVIVEYSMDSSFHLRFVLPRTVMIDHNKNTVVVV